MKSTLAALLFAVIFPQSLFAVSGDEALANARTHIGEPYKWGGGHGGYSTGSGVDCSGLVNVSYGEDFGTAQSQSDRSDCETVPDLSSAKAGDTIYFNRRGTSNSVHHVVMVSENDGNGRIMIVEAKCTGTRVYEHPLSDRGDLNTIKNIKRFESCTGAGNFNFLKQAYKDATGETMDQILKSRKKDLDFVFSDPLCVCNDSIMSLFKVDTTFMMKMLNPAVDQVVGSGRMMLEMNKIEESKLKNMKTLNGILSFSDKKLIPKIPNSSGGGGKCSEGNGCEPIDLSSKEGQEKYLHFIDCFENGGTGDYNAKSSVSSASGRYQFTKSTGDEYARKVGCSGDWRGSKDCQDRMFIRFTQDNAKGLQAKGVGINVCSLYLAHQQGVVGYLYIRDGSGTKPKHMRDNYFKNLPKSTQQRLEAEGTSHDMTVLRSEYIKYWQKQLGTDDIFDGGGASFTGGGGEKAGKDGFFSFMRDFLNLITSKRKHWRKGVLLELYHQNATLRRVRGLVDQEAKYSDRVRMEEYQYGN